MTRAYLAACYAFAALAVTAPVHAQVGAASAGEMRESSRETDASAIPRLASEVARPRAFAALSASVGALRDSMVSRAKESIGIRYLLGGSNPLIVLPDANLPAAADALKRSRSPFADSNAWPLITAATSPIACQRLPPKRTASASPASAPDQHP
jgi:hypothetical protein